MTWTTLEGEGDLLDSLATSDRCEVDTIGFSYDGHPIRLVRIGIPPKTGQHALFMTGCVHGSEPAGREALLEFAERLVSTDDPDETAFLEQWGVAFVPTVNPDGFSQVTQPSDDHTGRDNGAGVDLNRDFLELSQPETQAVGLTLADLKPVVAEDLHEYLPDPDDGLDVQVGRGEPAQAHDLTAGRAVEIRDMLLEHATSQGWDAEQWGGSQRGDIRLLDISTGLRHAASGIVETNRIDDSDAGRQHRASIQRSLVERLLAYTIAHIDAMVADRDQAIEEKIQEGKDASEQFYLRQPEGWMTPPEGYALSADQQDAVSTHASVYDIAISDGVASMAQASQPVIPYLLDAASKYRIVAGRHVPETGEWGMIVRGQKIYEDTTFPIPDGYDMIRVTLRGDVTDPSWIALRVNEDETDGLHRSKWVVDAGDDVYKNYFDGDYWPLAYWNTALNNVASATIYATHLSSSLLTYESTGYRAATGTSYRQESRCQGDLDSGRTLESLRVLASPNSIDLVRVWIEGVG